MTLHNLGTAFLPVMMLNQLFPFEITNGLNTITATDAASKPLRVRRGE